MFFWIIVFVQILRIWIFKRLQVFQCGTFSIQSNLRFHSEKSSNLGDVELLEADELHDLHPGQCITCSKSSCTSVFLVRCLARPVFGLAKKSWVLFGLKKKQWVNERQGPGQLAPYLSLPQCSDLIPFFGVSWKSHRIHGTIVYLSTLIVDFYGKCG